MPVRPSNVVSTREFRKNLDNYLAAARNGRGPVAVLDGSELVGYFIGPEEYEELWGKAVRKLLKERMKGPTVPHVEVREEVQKIVQRHSRKK